ncbi:MAG: addiction module protein [Deltaproteobacteria bacterium]|nr:addiction module protein [Deltaproteobacteria bacterium]
MAAVSSRLLSEAMKLPADERVRLAEKLLESAESEGFEDESAAVAGAWASEVQRRSRELADGSVRGMTVDEARRVVASDPDEP